MSTRVRATRSYQARTCPRGWYAWADPIFVGFFFTAVAVPSRAPTGTQALWRNVTGMLHGRLDGHGHGSLSKSASQPASSHIHFSRTVWARLAYVNPCRKGG